MRLTVLSPAYFPDLGPAHYLVRSAAANALPIDWYGVGKDYHSWYEVQIADLIPEIEQAETSHILYTDSRDVIACADLDEIVHRYNHMGAPPLLMSHEADGLNAGGWMGETTAAIEALYGIQARSGDWNPQTRWREAAADGSVQVAVDTGSRIFHVVEDPGIPASRPCFLHFAGGYNDPRYGRAERMQPYWEELGYA